MTTAQTKSAQTPVMNAEDERIFETVLQPLRMSLLAGFMIFGGGVILSVLTLIGVVPGAHTGSVWEWAIVSLGAVFSLAFLFGLIFVKPLALRSIARAKNAQQTL